MPRIPRNCRSWLRSMGQTRDRFEKEASFCVLCGLCVRYCAEVKKKNAIGFVDRGAKREINFIPEIASKECWNCKECFPLCPTSYLQAAYVLTEGLAFPPCFQVRVRGVGGGPFSSRAELDLPLQQGASPGEPSAENGHADQIPVWMLPSRTASSSAMAQDAEEMFPYL